MALFGSLFGGNKKNLRNPDLVWMHKGTKLKQLAQFAEKSAAEGALVIVSYFFKQTKQELLQASPNSVFEELTSLNTSPSNTSIYLVEHHSLRDSGNLYRFFAPAKAKKVVVCFAEHSPLHEQEEEIENALATIDNKEIKITYFVSLDEPLLVRFVGNNLMEMLSKMGLSENESISNAMIDKSIVNLQHKIREKVIFESKADSIESWLRMNLPEDIR